MARNDIVDGLVAVTAVTVGATLLGAVLSPKKQSPDPVNEKLSKVTAVAVANRDGWLAERQSHAFTVEQRDNAERERDAAADHRDRVVRANATLQRDLDNAVQQVAVQTNRANAAEAQSAAAEQENVELRQQVDELTDQRDMMAAGYVVMAFGSFARS